jgi:5-methylcytosine-specific restriction endonuclease McrA
MKCHKKTLVPPVGFKNKEDMIRQLRSDNDELIKERRVIGLDWTRFRNLVDIQIPEKIKNQTKETLNPSDRLKFETRDGGVCYICGSVYHYGSCNMYSGLYGTCKLSHLHHIIPNGTVNDNNIVTLCTHCHQMVHQAMYISGVWKYARPT